MKERIEKIQNKKIRVMGTFKIQKRGARLNLET